MNLPNESTIFLIFIVVGIIISMIFDLFRAIRKVYRTGTLATDVQDIIFWMISGLIMIYSVFVFNYGQIRGYVLLGIGLGSFVYFLTISKFFVIIFTKLINFVAFLIGTILLKPIKIVVKLVRKPFTFICINLQNSRKKFVQILSKITAGKVKMPNFSKKEKVKKDFSEKSRI